MTRNKFLVTLSLAALMLVGLAASPAEAQRRKPPTREETEGRSVGKTVIVIVIVVDPDGVEEEHEFKGRSYQEAMTKAKSFASKIRKKSGYKAYFPGK